MNPGDEPNHGTVSFTSETTASSHRTVTRSHRTVTRSHRTETSAYINESQQPANESQHSQNQKLKAKGWIAADSTLLGQAIAALDGSGIAQDGAFDERLGLTNEKVIAANAVYEGCLTIQNAARLQYPAKNDAAGNAQNITERANFLLDEFPPRDRSQPDGGTQGGDTPPAPPAP